MGERFRRGGGGGQAGDLPTEMPAYPRRKRKEKDASGGRLAEPPRRWCSREDRDLKRTPHAQRDRGPEGSRSDVHRETEEWKGEPRPTERSSKEITQGAALGDTEEEERMPCARREIERGHSGRCPRKGGKGGEGASSPEGGGGTGNPVRKGTRDAALPGRDSRPRRGPRALRGGWEGDRAGGTPRSAVWDPGEREAAGPSTRESRAEGSAAGSSGDVGLLLPRRRRAEGGRGQGSPRARRCPRGPEKVPCAGALSPDEVGAVAAEGGLLEEAGGEFVVLHLVHVLLPEGAFAGEAHGALLSLARRRPRGRVSHLARGEPNRR